MKDMKKGKVPAGQPDDVVPAGTVMLEDSSSEDDVDHVDMDDAIEMLNVVLGDDSSSDGDTDIAQQLEHIFSDS